MLRLLRLFADLLNVESFDDRESNVPDRNISPISTLRGIDRWAEKCNGAEGGTDT